MATFEDLKALPDIVVGELIDGVLVATPRPPLGHAAITTNLGSDLGAPFGRGRGGPGGWFFFDEPQLHLGADVVVPDLAAWRRERLPEGVPVDQPFFTLAPDWVCEVLSPRTARIDRLQKRRIYARAAVQFVWHIEPSERLLTAWRLNGADFQELGVWSPDETPTVRVAPFDALALDLASLWDGVTP